MNQIETLSMLTLSKSDHLSNEFHSVEFSEFSMRSNGGASTANDEDNRQQCLDTNETTIQPMKSVTFAKVTRTTETDTDADVTENIQLIPSIASYFSIIHDNQRRKIKNVENLFKTIGPILIKLESLVLDTSTGELDNMRLYYTYWENQLFELLIRYFELLSSVFACVLQSFTF